MEKQIEVAVNWWASQLATRTKQDNGDAVTGMLMGMLANTYAMPTAAQVETFKAALTEELKVETQKPYFQGIHNDYGADKLLRKAATASGIEANCPPFPIKTNMWIRPEYVSVRHGYGAEEEVLWEAKAAA